MREPGIGLVVITNQSAIGRGLIDNARLDQIHARMPELLHQENVVLDGIYYCPHRPEGHCNCRKPGVALLVRATNDLGFNGQDGFVIEDTECNIGMGEKLGANTMLILTGNCKKPLACRLTRPDFVVFNLAQAASMIESLSRKAEGPE